jgi:excisionase family DNA binding protein
MPRNGLQQVEASRADHSALVELGDLLAAEPRTSSPGVFLKVGDHSLRLPESIILGLRDMARHLTRGASIEVLPTDRDLSLQQAASLLGVSREFVRRLVNSGELPAMRVGTHQRISLADVLSYRDRRRSQRGRALSEMREQTVELGGYDDSEPR